jgi:hypothetical protein
VAAQVAQAVQAAVEAALSGQKKQDKLRAQVHHGFNQVRAWWEQLRRRHACSMHY